MKDNDVIPEDKLAFEEEQTNKRGILSGWMGNVLAPFRSPIQHYRRSKRHRLSRSSGTIPEDYEDEYHDEYHRNPFRHTLYKTKDVATSVPRSVQGSVQEWFQNRYDDKQVVRDDTASYQDEDSSHEIQTPNLLSSQRFSYNSQPDPYILQVIHHFMHQIWNFVRKHKWSGLVFIVSSVIMPVTLLIAPVLAAFQLLRNLLKMFAVRMPRNGREQLIWLYDFMLVQWHRFTQGTRRFGHLIITGALLQQFRHKKARRLQRSKRT